MKKILSAWLLMVMAAIFYSDSPAQDRTIWKSISDSEVSSSGNRFTIPQHYRTYKLNIAGLKNSLLNIPEENLWDRKSKQSNFAMPMPDGSFADFSICEVIVMHPDLAAKFPEIKTYAGQGITDPNAHLRIDVTPLGFHAMILSPNGQVFIDPYGDNTTEYYICYYKKDVRPASKFACEAASSDGTDYQNILPPSLYQQKSAGNQLRTYRLALACTGEYAATKGGTKSGALAGIVTSMNRVNGVYETEVAVRMVIIPNDTLILYTNSLTDPYTNGSGSTMLSQNQTTCDGVIGSANYDIGHVFSTGGGGVAYLGCVCASSNKAGGVTGSSNPVGDPFDIDYVAHEMGHQFGAHHTFNSVTSSCNGNRTSSAAFEPGSGITIMAYAGICGSDNLAPNSIAYFHTYSFDQIVNFTTTGGGNNCDVLTNTGNNPPVVTSVGAAYSIPISTPFVLTGSATDADNDPLTYSWEEFDLGPAGAWNVQSTTAPMFRPFPPTTSPSRTFPKISDVINNTTTIGELLPNQARTLKFRLTVRDNRTGGGGVMHPDTTLNISVVNSGGAFAVTAPNTAVTWAGGSTQTVTWNVNGTTNSPISCANVKISLSTDGGNTFPTVILASTPNDGSENITVPNMATSQARIKVEAVGNIFFDMSNANFTITAASLTAISTSAISPLSFCAGASLSVSYTTTGSANAGNVFTAQLSNSSGSFSSPVNIGTLSATGSGTIAGTIPSGTSTGTGYRIRVVSSNPVVTGSDNGANISISAQVGAAGAISGFNNVCQEAAPLYSVSAIANATTYNWSIPSGATIIGGAGTSTIQVAFSTSAVSGNISVFGSNTSCTGTSSSLFITVNPVPNLFSVTGGGSFCSGGSGVPIGLNGSQSGVGYQLIRNGSTNVGSAVSGTGSAISFGNQTVAGTYTVNGAYPTGCNSNMTGSVSITVNSNPTPLISGNTPFCQGNSITLNAGSGYSSYLWSTGAISQTISVGSSGTFTVTVTNSNGCSGSTTAATTVHSLPTVSFSGLASSYNVSDPPATLTGSPAGGTFSGPGISGNTFNPSLAGAGGPYNIMYSYTDGNGCSNSSIQQTTVNGCAVPAKPGTISATGGNTKVCPGDSKTYSIATVTGAASYAWTPPPGGNITSGQGTKTITVLYTSGFVANDSLRVVANNACGSSEAQALSIKRNDPAKPGTISGLNYGVCNLNGVPYSVTNVAGMTYNWNFTGTFAAIASGQGSNSITVDYQSGFIKETLSVTAGNSCGTSSARTLTVYSKPATAASISGPTSVCANQPSVPYSINAIPSAISYTWTGPSGSTISDGNVTSSGKTLTTTSTSVTVNFGSTAGYVQVKANNNCGTGSNKSLTITFNCRQSGMFIHEFALAPVPADEYSEAIFNCEGQTQFAIRLINPQGKLLSEESGITIPGENRISLNLNHLPSGIYFVELNTGDKRFFRKLIRN